MFGSNCVRESSCIVYYLLRASLSRACGSVRVVYHSATSRVVDQPLLTTLWEIMHHSEGVAMTILNFFYF